MECSIWSGIPGLSRPNKAGENKISGARNVSAPSSRILPSGSLKVCLRLVEEEEQEGREVVVVAEVTAEEALFTALLLLPLVVKYCIVPQPWQG